MCGDYQSHLTWKKEASHEMMGSGHTLGSAGMYSLILLCTHGSLCYACFLSAAPGSHRDL